MRALVRFCSVKEMIGVDATEQIVERGREICRAEGLDECISFVLGDACATGLPAGEAEFVWGEDAWCYVEDKRALIVEAARLLRPGGTIAFTDWVEGPAGLEAPEAERLLRFMRFPSILNIDDYRRLFSLGKTPDRGLGRYRAIRPYFDLYRENYLEEEREFVRQLGSEGKLVQAIHISRRIAGSWKQRDQRPWPSPVAARPTSPSTQSSRTSSPKRWPISGGQHGPGVSTRSRRTNT